MYTFLYTCVKLILESLTSHEYDSDITDNLLKITSIY